MRQFAAQLLIDRIVHDCFVRVQALGRLCFLAALALDTGFRPEILDLVLELNDVRIGIVEGQPQRIELRLQFCDACPELSFTGSQNGHLGFAAHLPLERRTLHLGLPQLQGRILDAGIERNQPRAKFGFATGACIQVRRPQLSEFVFGDGELMLVLLRLLVDEFECRENLRFLLGDNLGDEQFRKSFRHEIRALRLVVAVVDVDDRLASAGCVGERRALLDLLDELVLIHGGRAVLHPSTPLKNAVHNLAAENNLARVLAAVGDIGRHCSPQHQRLDDVLVVDEYAGSRRIGPRPDECRRQRRQVHNHEQGHEQPARVEGLVDERLGDLFRIHFHGVGSSGKIVAGDPRTDARGR